ncbi:MAG: Hsp33 family molecular chaperone HslO [Ruminococcaceae bacterium]|nr:Hsp33 family molecular chaperone HslO [Oscillospiraceae bacterium]
MGKLIRCITSDGLVIAAGIDSTDICAKAEQLHQSSAVVTAALGRLLTAASLMGNALKADAQSLTLRISGGGPIGTVTAVSDQNGNVRGCVTNPIVEIPLKPNGKLDVSGAVGTQGSLYVMKDLGMREPYNGFVPLVSGEIAEDITSYYATSEQIPTVCALGVLINPDLTVRKAGGYIIQLLPAAHGYDEVINKLEKNISEIKPITALLDEGFDIEDIIKRALNRFEVEVLSETNAEYRCNCSRERSIQVLKSLSVQELEKLADELTEVEVNCHFCNSQYKFSKEEIKKIIKDKN